MFYCPAFDVLRLLHKFPFMAYVCLKIRLAAGVNIYCLGKLNEKRSFKPANYGFI